MEAPRATEVKSYMPGMQAYTTPRGIRVVTLDYWVNPTHTAEWVAKQRPLYATNKDWRREMERDWSSPAGEPYFPDFSLIGKEAYVHYQTKFVDEWPVFRAFDFGRRRPAAIWFQYSPRQDRVIAYREFMPHDILSVAFRDAVRYLSGEISYGEVPAEGRRWIDEYAARPSGAHCPPPWFPPGTKFINIAGHEARMGQANAPNPEEAVVAEIFASGNVPLVIVTPHILGRNHIIDRLLMMKEDGFPGILIDPQMEESIEGFEGAWAFPEATKAVPIPVKPKKDGHYDNLLDAWGYGVAAVVPADQPAAPRPPQIVGYKDGRTPIYRVPTEEEVRYS